MGVGEKHRWQLLSGGRTGGIHPSARAGGHWDPEQPWMCPGQAVPCQLGVWAGCSCICSVNPKTDTPFLIREIFLKLYNFTPLSGEMKRKTLCMPSCWQMKRGHFKHPQTWMPLVSCHSCHQVWPLALEVSATLEMDSAPPSRTGSSSDGSTVLTAGVGCGEGISGAPTSPGSSSAAPGCGSTRAVQIRSQARGTEPTSPVQLLRLLSGWLLMARTQWINTFMFPNWRFVQSAWMKEMFLL